VWLPPAYAKTQPYPLVVQAPGCGADGTAVYSLSPTNTDADAGASGTVIRVGLTPPPNSIGHATNQNQGCFDDKEGDDSVDFVFFEKLLDQLKTELCYDENRVFVSGNSSGSWLANELVVKYAGDTKGHAVRGVISNMGGLPTEVAFAPTPSGKPYGGVWVFEIGDVGTGSSGWRPAVNKAMQVAGCTASSYETAQTVAFPVGGGALATSCKRIQGCSTLHPLIVCPLAGNGHGPHDEVVNPASATFIDLLAAP
jgi:poly(3-hydroxybutyrate) depolymerase